MRRLQHSCLFLMTLLVILACSQHALGQGTNGLVTDPMGLRESRELIDRYAKLRKEQWPLLEGAHDDYLVKFTALRDGPVQDYLDEIKGMNAGMTGQIPEVDVVREMFEKGERISRRIASVDDEFFRNVTVLVDEDQVPGIARARMARQRQRNSSNQMSLGSTMGLQSADEAYWTLELTDEEHALLEPHLRSYESTMVSLTGERLESANRSMLNMIEALVELGYGDFSNQDMQDPEKAQAFMQAIQEAMAMSMVGLAETQTEIDKREMTLASQIKSLLPPEKSHAFFKRWLARTGATSMGLQGGGIDELEAAYTKTIRSDSLDESDVEAVDTIMTDWRKRDVEYFLDIANEAQLIGQQAYSGGGLANPESMGRAYEGIIEINKLRNQSASKTRDRIIALLGEDRADAFVRSADKGEVAPVIQGFGDQSGERTIVISAGDENVSVGGFRNLAIPRAVSIEDVSLYAQLLQLSDSEQEIFEALHAGYLEAWKDRVDGRVWTAVTRPSLEGSEAPEPSLPRPTTRSV